MNKTLEQWSKVDAPFCAAKNSVNANMFLIKDAQADIKTLSVHISELEDEIESLKHWRNLALQFDHHRMTALAHLKALVANPEHKETAEEFLKGPPVPAHEVEADLSKALFWLRHAKPLLHSGGFNLAADDIGNFLSGFE